MVLVGYKTLKTYSKSLPGEERRTRCYTGCDNVECPVLQVGAWPKAHATKAAVEGVEGSSQAGGGGGGKR